MTTGEKFILDALANLSKSMSRIADELHKIGEVITYDHRTRRGGLYTRMVLLRKAYPKLIPETQTFQVRAQLRTFMTF